MRPCTLCSKSNKQCLVGADSDRCSNCVSGGRKCDLVVSPMEMRRVERRRNEIWQELSETLAKASRLQKQFEAVEKEKRKLVERELQNIEELEEDERSRASANPNPDDLLFDVSSEQFEFPENFDWSAFRSSHDTVAEAPGSSQGS